MPTLLSPRGSAKALGDDGVVKKPKGVMGRIKSTFKLGRRKSSTGASSISAAAIGTVSVEKDEGRSEEPQTKDEDDADEKDQENEVAVPYEDDISEIKAFEVEEESQQQEEEAKQAQPAAIDDRAENKRVATFELPPKQSEEQVSHGHSEQEEVFACDYKAGESLQTEDPTPDEDDEDEVEVFEEESKTNQSNTLDFSGRGREAPHESDLMVVGVSPAKFRAVSGPSASPVKRIQQATLQNLEIERPSNQEAPGPSRADTELGLGDRIASARSTRPTHQTSTMSSPARRSQLLSDFQFGTEALGPASAAISPVPASPMKRRSSASPTPPLQPRRSFQRDQELVVNASSPSKAVASPTASPSAKRKPDTPSTIPSVRASRPERRASLQGITEEDTKPRDEEIKLPPRPSAGAGRRRSSANADAPILTSSFGTAVSEPEVHDDHAATGDALPVTQDADQAQEDETGSGAFAFDAGAAITTEFGERVARLLGADPWGDRQDGFDAIVYQIKKTDLANARNKRELFCAAVAAVQCGVEDRVAPVMYCALESLRAVLKEFSPVLDRSFLKYSPMNEQLSGLTKAIVTKLGDSNKRTQREASQAVVRLAKLKKLKVLPHVLLHLSAKEVSPRQRVETLRLLVKELGVDNQTAMNIEVVMQFAVPVLKIADEKTRKAAVELIAELHLVNGQAVNVQLAGVKPEMLRVINRRVDELLAKREEERQQQQQQAAQNANQAEDAGDDAEATMTLVAVPVEDSKAVVELLDAMNLQAQNVVGPVAWHKLESKTWSDRKEALVDMEKTVTEAKSDLRDVKPAFNSVVQHNFLGYCTVVYRCLSDSIAPVVNSAMDGFSTLIKVYGPCVEWREDAVRDLILLTIMRLFGTMQKPNNRTNRAACRCILKLTRLTNPHTLRYALSCVFAKETDALVQMHLLRLLVPEFGFQPEGISPGRVLELVAMGLAHANDKVRKTATDVALCTQRLVGKEFVLKKLKDVVKPVTLKELEKSFVDVDISKDSERPQTVHATAATSTAATSTAASLPPVQFGGERRLLHSAPVGLGKLHCTPPGESEPRGSTLSHDEESLMDSILGSGDL